MTFTIGIDVGGTFTDGIVTDDTGAIYAAKTPSTSAEYGEGVLAVLDDLAKAIGTSTADLLGSTGHIAHGTTASINALVQNKGARVGLLCTKGHADSLRIMNCEGRVLGRSAHEIQDILRQRKPPALVPKRLTMEVTERIDSAGRVITSLDEAEVAENIRVLLDAGVDAIAVSLLWSFRNPVHEQRIREIARGIAPHLYIALSSEVSPRIREFSRTATTVMNCMIGPALHNYLQPLESRLKEQGLDGSLLVMQSNGGTVAAADAPASAITTVGSVLSGGVVGALRLADQLGHHNVITTDVGGTTFLVGLIVDGQPVRTTTTIVSQHPVNVPSIRVDAIGAGGGAIAWIDAGGNLQVGPHSAEAVPGPACYNQGGTEPTNTDANLVLGILSPERGLLGGRRPLQLDAARSAIESKVANPLGLTVEQAAAAIYAIQNAQTGDLLRKTVVEAGYDPRDFKVYAFGGAGPAHCAAYADELGATEVVVPLGQVASSFSAYGLATADLMWTAERSEPSFFPGDPARISAIFAELEDEIERKLKHQGIHDVVVETSREVDLRYSMQVDEIPTPVPNGELDNAELATAADNFERLYAQMNGEDTAFTEAGIQVITYRVQGRAQLSRNIGFPAIDAAQEDHPESALRERRPVCLDFRAGYVDTPVYDYRRLLAGHVIPGPAVIEVETTTAVIPQSWSGRIDDLGNLILTKKAV